MISYLIVASISGSIGFLLGAVWSGLGAKNKECDETIRKEYEK